MKESDVISEELRNAYKKIFAMRREGASYRDIAKKYNWTIEDVRKGIQWCKIYEYPPPEKSELLNDFLIEKNIRRGELIKELNKKSLNNKEKIRTERELTNVETMILQLSGKLKI